MATVDLWLECRAAKGRHLPYAGGIANQPAALWDAFRTLQMLAATGEGE